MDLKSSTVSRLLALTLYYYRPLCLSIKTRQQSSLHQSDLCLIIDYPRASWLLHAVEQLSELFQSLITPLKHSF